MLHQFSTDFYHIKLFADDTSLYMLYLVIDDPLATAEILNTDLYEIDKSSTHWLVFFNLIKTKSMLISRNIQPVTHLWQPT